MRKGKRRAKKVRARCPLGTPVIENACAFCRLHGYRLTVKQMKNRQCLDKKCRHFRPRKQHTYWASHGPWKYEEEDE